MSDDFSRFLRESAVSARVRLPGRVVIGRTKLTPAGIVRIRENGSYDAPDGEVCELEVGGVVIARGEIVEENGRHLFRPFAGSGDNGGKE